MRLLRGARDVIPLDKIKNEFIRKTFKVAPIQEKRKENQLRWNGRVMRRDDSHTTKKISG